MKDSILLSGKPGGKAGTVTLRKRTVGGMVAFVVVSSTLVLPAGANDLFAGAKTTIMDTFGSGSTVIWILYMLEILGAIFAYIKTKNLAMFGGIAAIMVFVNVTFGLIP